MEEMCEILDENNQVIGIISRSDAKKRPVKLKAAFVILTNSRNQFFLAQRCASKVLSPLKWAVGAGGVVKAGETFEEGAARELKEELGLNTQIKYLFDFEYFEKFGGYFGKVFLIKFDGKVNVDMNEYIQGNWFSKAEVLALDTSGDLAPDTALFFKKYLKTSKKE